MIGRVGDGMQGMQGLGGANARWVAFGTGALRALPAAGPAPARHPCWGSVIVWEIGDRGSWESGVRFQGTGRRVGSSSRGARREIGLLVVVSGPAGAGRHELLRTK